MTVRRCAPRPTLRFWIGLCLAATSLLALSLAHADPADDSLRLYAADIWHDPPQSWGPGRGVYLGNGLVLTAAHVVGSALAAGRTCASPGWTCLRKPSRKGTLRAWT